MPETQPRVGHLRGVSTNDTKKTGPAPPTGQPRPGHLRSVSKAEGKGGGGGAPAPLTTKGYGQASRDKVPNATKLTGTGRPKPAKGGSY